MSLFDKLKEPVFYKDDSEAEKQLAVLKELAQRTTDDALIQEIEKECKLVEAGIEGEKQVRFELKNSHIPMYVLHDLYFEYGDLTAQIDFLIITRKHNFILECKNLFGNIEINGNGDFIRNISYGKTFKKEGIYSPITQNRRHLELIKQLRRKEKGALSKLFFEKNFENVYRSVVVLANPKTVLNAKYAKKEIRNQVIRADQLIEFIRQTNQSSNLESSSDKEMETLAQFFLNCHKAREIDYTAKFREKIAAQEAEKETATLICPRCGAELVLRVAKKGENVGKRFYGCSGFPHCRYMQSYDESIE